MLLRLAKASLTNWECTQGVSPAGYRIRVWSCEMYRCPFGH